MVKESKKKLLLLLGYMVHCGMMNASASHEETFCEQKQKVCANSGVGIHGDLSQGGPSTTLVLNSSVQVSTSGVDVATMPTVVASSCFPGSVHEVKLDGLPACVYEDQAKELRQREQSAFGAFLASVHSKSLSKDSLADPKPRNYEDDLPGTVPELDSDMTKEVAVRDAFGSCRLPAGHLALQADINMLTADQLRSELRRMGKMQCMENYTEFQIMALIARQRQIAQLLKNRSNDALVHCVMSPCENPLVARSPSPVLVARAATSSDASANDSKGADSDRFKEVVDSLKLYSSEPSEEPLVVVDVGHRPPLVVVDVEDWSAAERVSSLNNSLRTTPLNLARFDALFVGDADGAGATAPVVSVVAPVVSSAPPIQRVGTQQSWWQKVKNHCSCCVSAPKD